MVFIFLLYLGVGEVNDRSVISEHVNFLDTGNGVDGELLELRLEFFVVSVGSLVHDLLLPAGSTFASDSDVSLLKTIVRNKKCFQFLDVFGTISITCFLIRYHFPDHLTTKSGCCESGFHEKTVIIYNRKRSSPGAS